MDIWASRKTASSWKTVSLQWWPHAALVNMKTPHLGTRWICRAHLPSIMTTFHPITTDYLICGVFDATADRWALRVQICLTFRSSNINQDSVTSLCVFRLKCFDKHILIDCLAAVRDRLWPGRLFVLVGIGPRPNTTYMRHSAIHHTLWLVGDLSNCVQRHFGVPPLLPPFGNQKGIEINQTNTHLSQFRLSTFIKSNFDTSPLADQSQQEMQQTKGAIRQSAFCSL